MGRLALVGGTGLLGVESAAATPQAIETAVGAVELLDAGGHVVLQRHGAGTYRPPHRIDHHANLEALREAGCDRVLALASVGSLRRDLPTGTFVCPDDFIALQLGGSRFDDERGHLVPGFSPEWRERVVSAWTTAASVPIRDGGVYWQAIGPRLETPAEVRLIAAHADVVGMTIASECLAANEAGVEYAAVCVVDNLANGVERAEGPAASLTMAELLAGVERNRPALLESVDRVLAELAA
jgi:5'-methylthioadenosine phosphorylase